MGGGLIEAGDLLEMGGLFNLEKSMASVLHKELEQKVEKLKNKKDGGHAAEDQNQIRTSSWSWSWLINTVYHLLVKNK